MAEAYRVLKQDRVAVMFYGWTKVDAFFDAWRCAGFQPVGHIVFRKSYSSKSRFLQYQHEQAYPLAKGRPPLPKRPLSDVMDMLRRVDTFASDCSMIFSLKKIVLYASERWVSERFTVAITTEL
jgi:hypothetical protein